MYNQSILKLLHEKRNWVNNVLGNFLTLFILMGKEDLVCHLIAHGQPQLITISIYIYICLFRGVTKEAYARSLW